MIDTDKYEGHTEGPWKIEGAKTIIGAEDLRITVKGGTQRDKNLRLVADAPLLLEEVKRLREVQKKIGSLICDECGLSIEEHIRYHTENDVIAGCPFGED